MLSRSLIPVPMARSHRWWQYAGWGVGVLGLVLLLPTQQIDVVFRQGVHGEAWPVALALLGAGLPAVLASPGRDLESALPRRPWQTRACTAVVVAAITLGVSWLACAMIERPMVIGFRNALLSVGLALGSALVVGSRLSWVVPTALATTTWLRGFDDRSNPHVWAILLHPPGTRALELCAALFLVTGLAWVGKGDRQVKDEASRGRNRRGG